MPSHTQVNSYPIPTRSQVIERSKKTQDHTCLFARSEMVYIKAVDSIKDLGVIISSDLKFNHHISSIVARGHRVNNLIYKCFHCRDADVLLKVYSLVGVSCADMFLVCNSKTRGHNMKLSVQYSRIDVRKFFFSNRVVQPWNSLKAQPADFSSVRYFKRFSDKTNFSRFLHFC